MKRPHQTMSLVFMLLSAFVGWQSLRLQYYTPLGPGPGFFPFWLAVVFGMLSAFALFQATRGRPEPMPAAFLPQRNGYLRICAIVLSTVAFILLLNPLGFRLTVLAFYLFMPFALGRVNPIATIVVALAGSFGVYHVFTEWLFIPLPVGAFGV